MKKVSDENIARDKVKVAILLGLKHSGRKKTFAQILDDAGLQHDAVLRFKVANSLEASGLIQAVSYQLPVAIQAELSQAGENFVNTRLLSAGRNTMFGGSLR